MNVRWNFESLILGNVVTFAERLAIYNTQVSEEAERIDEPVLSNSSLLSPSKVKFSVLVRQLFLTYAVSFCCTSCGFE